MPLQDLVKAVLHAINDVAKTAQGCLLVGRSFDHHPDLEWLRRTWRVFSRTSTTSHIWTRVKAISWSGEKWAGLVDVGSAKMQEGQAAPARKRRRGASAEGRLMVEEEKGKFDWAEEMAFDFVE